MITVIAIMTAKAGKKEQVLAIAKKNLATVRAEQGCHEYRLVEDVKNAGAVQTPLGKDTFMFIEGWENKQALEKHLATSHMKAYFAETAPLMADQTIHILESAE